MAYAELITPPSITPITLSDAKAHLRVDINDDDALIMAYVQAATGIVEEYLRRRLISQVWKYWWDAFPDGNSPVVFPVSPVLRLLEFKYLDPDFTTWKNVPAEDYIIEIPKGDNPARGRIILAFGSSWPIPADHPHSVSLVVEAGYSTTNDGVPEPIKTAIRLLVGNFYANRESVITGTIVTKMPMNVEYLLSPYRLFEFSK